MRLCDHVDLLSGQWKTDRSPNVVMLQTSVKVKVFSKNQMQLIVLFLRTLDFRRRIEYFYK